MTTNFPHQLEFIIKWAAFRLNHILSQAFKHWFQGWQVLHFGFLTVFNGFEENPVVSYNGRELDAVLLYQLIIILILLDSAFLQLDRKVLCNVIFTPLFLNVYIPAQILILAVVFPPCLQPFGLLEMLWLVFKVRCFPLTVS